MIRRSIFEELAIAKTEVVDEAFVLDVYGIVWRLRHLFCSSLWVASDETFVTLAYDPGLAAPAAF